MTNIMYQTTYYNQRNRQDFTGPQSLQTILVIKFALFLKLSRLSQRGFAKTKLMKNIMTMR